MGKLSEKNKTVIIQCLYMGAFVLLLCVDYVSATSIMVTYSGRIIQLAILLMGVKIFLTHYTKKEWVLLIIGGCLAAISFFCTRNYYVCTLIMLIMASKDIALKVIMKCYLFVVIAITVLVGLLAVLGICGDVFLVQDFRGIGEETRYCMGFTHPNTYHIVLVQLLLAFIWINWKRIRWYYFAVFFMVNLGITYFTDSRTSFIVGSCVCVAYLLIKIVPFLQRWIGTYLIGFGVLVACVALSVYVAMFGHMRPFTSALNKLWTNRVYWAYTARLESQLTLFSGTEYQISCDMGFIKICYCYGIIIILLVLGLMVWRFAKAAYHKEVVVLIGLVACLVFFLGETFASGEFVTRNLLFIYMLGWGKDSIYVSEEESDTRTISMYY